MLGATRMSTDLIPAANAIGYSPDICSYLTADIGAYLKGITPLAKAYPGIESRAKSDVLVYNTNQCRDVQDWLAWYRERLGVPSIGITSPKNVNEVTDAHIDDVTRQIEALIPALERIAGEKLDMDRLRENGRALPRVHRTVEAGPRDGHRQPRPLTFFDGTIHMGPAVVLRGTREAIDYYKLLLAELEQRIARQAWGPSKGRTSRIYWEGMPVWGRLRQHSELFAESPGRPSWPPPTAAAGSSRPSMGGTRSAVWPRPISSCSSSAPTGTRRSTSRRCWRNSASTASSTTTPRPAPTTPTAATACPAAGSRNRCPEPGHLRGPQRPCAAFPTSRPEPT